MKTIKGYKGFDKDMKCRDFQFEDGKVYETDKAVICQEGFHFCTDPFDVLNYYPVTESTFAEVESVGDIDQHSEDSKISTTKIKITAKLSLGVFINAAVSFLLNNTKKEKPASGDYSKLAASGDYSKLAASGDSSKLAASGHSSQLAASGDSSKLDITGADSVGAAIGVDNTIKAEKGNWITLAEWLWDEKKNRWVPVCVKSVQVDGKKIKANVFYKLQKGKFVEVK
jgi:hypothetical protein